MRRALTASLLMLCFSAAAYRSATAQQGLSKAPAPEGGEAVGALVSLLKNARSVVVPRTNSTERLSSVRAEGCVLRYNIASAREFPTHNLGDSTQPQNSNYLRTDREVTVNLADLDAAGVRVWNPLQMKNGGWVSFYMAGGRETVSESWVTNSRLGVRPLVRWQKGGSLPLRDDGSLETVAAALKRAVEACAASAR